MTLKQAIDIALSYAEVKENKTSYTLLCHFADVAQKEIAIQTAKIVKRFNVAKTSSVPITYQFPRDSAGFYKIIRRGSVLPINYTLCGGDGITISDYGEFDIYYYVLPNTISCETKGDYKFEVDVKTHGAIPFYIAHRISENQEISRTCFSEWNKLNSLARLNNTKHNEYYKE